jgi:hypothetical protein
MTMELTMSDTVGVVEPAESVVVERPDVRLVPAGQPAGPVIEALLTALRQGTISPKLGREMLIRLVPPAKPTVRLPLPKITDAESYAAATQRILKAAAMGKIAPADAVVMMRAAKGAYEAVRAAERVRLLHR